MSQASAASDRSDKDGSARRFLCQRAIAKSRSLSSLSVLLSVSVLFGKLVKAEAGRTRTVPEVDAPELTSVEGSVAAVEVQGESSGKRSREGRRSQSQ